MNNLEAIRNRLREFSDARDWDQFHSPKNLSMALSVEVSELVECFQWLTEDQSRSLTDEQLSDISDEIADVQLYLVLLADKLGIDISIAVDQKIKKNEEKYPADKVKGSSKKYDQY
ncbi:MAG: nucleotide pyrophosphohydrolase [Methylophilus methylotrophus]|jgi:NTP pyrophosphatase (non-canonical NTP hydrolase)|uniref:Nucleotide pyrophosphohydrolase n=1 Tax=Methylophilus methylotrophus TaxID=17 RepID=A0A5C7WGM8_METME|nr:MAG: nucleotide pyrophosphohydrolase [Methylophilus methylotrophus]